MRRLQTLLLSFSLITIASSSSISKRCKDPNWELTLDNYKKANVDQWLAWWWPQQTDHSKSVADLIANEFFDDTGRHCPTSPGDTSGDCTNVISCNSVNVNKANVTQAYFAYNSMVNLNTGLNFYISGLQNVSTLDILQSYDLVSKFTQSAVAPTDNMILKRLLGFVSTLLSAAGSFVGTAGSVAITATNGGIAQLTLGLKDPKTQSEVTLDSLKTYNNFLASIYKSVQSGVGDAKTALFKGNKDASNNDIFGWIKDGAYVALEDETEAKISDFFYKTMTGGAINALWRANMVYIVGTPSDNCENANNPEAQGYHAKVCLPGEKSAYYVYMLGNHGSPYPQVIPPVGWNHLGELGLGMQNVVASSVAAWRATAFNYANAANHRWNDARNWGSGNTPRDKGASFEGVWTIPVCWDPKGTAVTNMKTDKGRTYPCACGQGPNSEDSGAFAAASGMLEYSDKYATWCTDSLS